MRAPAVVIFGVVLAIVLTPVAAIAGPLEDGLDAHNSGDYAAALRDGASPHLSLVGELMRAADTLRQAVGPIEIHRRRNLASVDDGVVVAEYVLQV